MKNKYDGKCIFCSIKVPKLQEICWQDDINGWVISCIPCTKNCVNLSKKLHSKK